MNSNKQFNLCYELINFLAQSGLKKIYASPGSRSTPLLLAALKHPSVDLSMSIDERTAAFAALGYTRVKKDPVALLCTSGTAAAHYLPAIIEADLQSLPIIALTADRPAHLRSNGVNQTINQVDLYSHFASSCDLALYRSNTSELTSKLYELSESYHFERPLQINIELDKPLEPTTEAFAAEIPTFSLKKSIQQKVSCVNLEIDTINQIKASKRPLFIGGPSNEASLFKELYHFIEKAQIPFICELSSGFYQQCEHHLPPSQAFIFLAELSVLNEMTPDLIISSGQSSTANIILQFLAQHIDTPQIHFNGTLKERQNPHLKKNIHHYRGHLQKNLFDGITPQIDTSWQEKWMHHNKVYEQNKFASTIASENELMTEERFYQLFARYYLPKKKHAIFLGNSSIPRDIDRHLSNSKTKIESACYSTRGASGIDGLVAQAFGSVENNGLAGSLIIGDVSFQHDVASLDLLAKNAHIPLQIFILNNGGGKIFDRLPIAAFPSIMSNYYHTPPSLQISVLCNAYKIDYYAIQTVKDWKEYVHSSPNTGIKVIEIMCDASKSIEHKKMLNTIY